LLAVVVVVLLGAIPAEVQGEAVLVVTELAQELPVQGQVLSLLWLLLRELTTQLRLVLVVLAVEQAPKNTDLTDLTLFLTLLPQLAAVAVALWTAAVLLAAQAVAQQT
jgi:hypothetical protein